MALKDRFYNSTQAMCISNTRHTANTGQRAVFNYIENALLDIRPTYPYAEMTEVKSDISI